MSGDKWDALRQQARDGRESLMVWSVDLLELLDERDRLERELTEGRKLNEVLAQQAIRQQLAIEVLKGGYKSLVICKLCSHHWGVADSVVDEAERIQKGEEP